MGRVLKQPSSAQYDITGSRLAFSVQLLQFNARKFH